MSEATRHVSFTKAIAEGTKKLAVERLSHRAFLPGLRLASNLLGIKMFLDLQKGKGYKLLFWRRHRLTGRVRTPLTDPLSRLGLPLV